MSINSDLQTTGLLLGAKQTPFQQEQDQFSDFLRTLQTTDREVCAKISSGSKGRLVREKAKPPIAT